MDFRTQALQPADLLVVCITRGIRKHREIKLVDVLTSSETQLPEHAAHGRRELRRNVHLLGDAS
jgi:hypothetical protein